MTYSIVARDPDTGQMGVAVQSHWFSVGTVVTWGAAGVGVVATQALAEVSYGPLGVELMHGGKTAEEALRALLAADENSTVRQVAMLDARGGVAVHTGERAIAEAGHAVGDQVGCQANMMLRSTVWDAMLAAYGSAQGDLAERLLGSLEAAEGEGGDIRGRQSAAILVVAGEHTGKPLNDRPFDLRVEDHPEPLKELRRLVGIKRAYDGLHRADDLLGEGESAAAAKLYADAQQALGDNIEPTFWAAVTMASSGRMDEAKALIAPVFAANPNWRELLRRLPDAGLADEAVAKELLDG